MDFDSIVTFLFLIAFFVLPSILKQVVARKNKKTGPLSIKKKSNIIGRAGEKILKFIQELEAQARQQRQATKNQENIWDTLTEEEEPSSVSQSVDINADFIETPVEASRKKPEPKIPEPPYTKNNFSQKAVQQPSIEKPVAPLPKDFRLKPDPLQNAIVWSEILSKPLALRKE